MAIRISTHNGTKIAHKHNIRDKKTISKEPHINPNRPSKTWLDKPIKEMYEKIFQKSVDEYNKKQNVTSEKQHQKPKTQR